MKKTSIAIAAIAAAVLNTATAQASTYTADNDIAASQTSLTVTSYGTGYSLWDTGVRATNEGADGYISLVWLAKSLNDQNAVWSSADNLFRVEDLTTMPTGSITYASYDQVGISEPTDAGYVPGGTVPLFDIGYLKTGQSVDFHILEINSSNVGVMYGAPQFVSSVPLPASAPMFGAALLALGAVGFGAKRRKAAAA